jgi:NAD(P)-dependent dehydrogenase (short-subunit alcohol dehydrogenase family)
MKQGGRMSERTVLITGCSSGFGRLTAKTFHGRGWNVIATMRSPEKENELKELDHMLVTRLDVTDPASIGQAMEEGVERFGAIHVLVNNAGFGGHALFEQFSDGTIHAMYDTNVFGLMNVTRAVLPRMRRQGEGCVINVTSLSGLVGTPTSSIYSSTKWAVEGLTEALALEYGPLGIRFKTVAPGAYPATRFRENTDSPIAAGGETLSAYAGELRGQIQAISQRLAGESGNVPDPQEVADRIYACATTETPVRNPVGADAELLTGLMEGAETRQAFLDRLMAMLAPQTGV